MLTIEYSIRKNCHQRVTRRDFVQLGSLALGGLSLPGFLATRAQAADSAWVKNKSVVLVYLSGGGSQFELFDPKMDAPAGIRSLTGETPTSLTGVTFGGTMSRLATQAHQMAVVRSFGHNVTNHADAHVHMLSGGTDPQGKQQQGYGMGALCTYLGGTHHPRTGLPTYALLTENEIDRQYQKEVQRIEMGSWPGSLGTLYSPFIHQTGWQPPKGRRQPHQPRLDNMRLKIPARHLQDRLQLSRALDQLQRLGQSPEMDSLDEFSQQAVDLVVRGAAEAFQLEYEERTIRQRYDTQGIQVGHREFRPCTLGDQLLLARRLCESGCRYVTIHSAGWDMHADANNPGMIDGMQRQGRALDIAVSAFLDDVAERGLSEQILLILMGDFGRTPKVNPRGGRDHWSRLSPLMLAGGGLRMGQVVGQSNRDGSEPNSTPYTTRHLMGTVLHTLFDMGKLRLAAGLPREVTSVTDQHEPIGELI